MKRIFSIFVATLLLSTTLLAQNVAKVTQTADGTPVGEYPTMAEALAAWTDGTTLTMLDNATYNATATYTVSGIQTLDLAGKTLTWDADANATNVISLGANAALNIKDNTAQKGVLSFTTAAKAVKVFDVNASTKSLNVVGVKVEVNATGTGDGRVIYAGNSCCVFSITNTDFAVQNNVRRILETGIYSGEGVCQDKFENVAVDFAANCTLFGIQAFRTGRASFALQNCEIDMSKLTGMCRAIFLDKKCDLAIVGGQYIVGAGRPANSVVEFSSNDGSSCSIKKGTAEPVFDAPMFIALPNPVSILKKNKANVECGKFFTSLLPYTMAPEGKHFEQKTENGKSYYVLEDGAYVLGLQNTLVGYTDAQKCISEVNSGTINVLSSADFTIPAEKKFTLLNESSNKSLATITNEGNITISTGAMVVKGNWSNFKIVNKGSLTMGGSSTSKPNTQMYVDNVTIENTGTLTLTGYPTLEWEIHYGKDFKIDNKEGGSVSVSSGFFAADAKSQIENYLAEGYSLFAFGDGYRVAQQGAMVAQVGTVQYNDLAEALEASSKNEYAKLLTSFPYTAIRVNGRHAYLDLNGKTLTLTSSDSFVENGSLTIKNGTLNCTEEFVFDMYGSTNQTATNYSVLNIESDVTITQATGKEYFAAVSQIQANQPYGIVVNFNGTYEGQCPFYVNGSLITIADNAPTFNIGSTAKFTSNSLAYAAGYGIWNYSGEAITSHHGFELRAGKLTMNGGSIVCTATKPADDQFNGNGSTSQACAIAVCQHSTQLPVNVVVNGGELKAYTPIYQANPQNNPQEAIDKVSVEVNNAKVFSTSKNIVWSANKKVVLNGGVYNLSPAAYIAEGKAVVENTNPDTKEMYPYTIGEKAAAVATAQAGNWNETATWVGGAVPTAATPVVMKHAVVIPANIKAEVMGMDVQGGAITVEGTLVIGNDGIKGITNANQLLVKDGGALVISPVATKENSQPLATVELKTVIRDVKDEYAAGDRSYEYIWQNIGLPVTSMTITPAKTLTVNTWDIMSAWIPATEFGTAFRGYHITNMNNKTAGVLYTFAGQLVGNQNATLSMPRDGFHFFGNSWMAPFDVKEILNQLNSKSANGVVTPAVYVYVSDKLTIGNKTYNDGQYMDITLAQLDNADYAAALGQIAAMQGFFLHSDGQANISLNYEKAVWNATLAKPAKAPKYTMEEATAVRISLTAENGRSDEVYLYEGEAFAAPKMMNVKPNVNIYAITANGTYSTMGLDKVEGTQLGIQTNAKTNYTISFDWLKGETLYLKDKKENKYIAMTEGTTYSFTAEANTTIDNRFEIVGKSNVPTMMENTESNIAATGIYSITGQYIGETTMWNTLPAGLYIVNGQKRVK